MTDEGKYIPNAVVRDLAATMLRVTNECDGLRKRNPGCSSIEAATGLVFDALNRIALALEISSLPFADQILEAAKAIQEQDEIQAMEN